MINIRSLRPLITAVLICTLWGFQAHAWELISDEDQIKVYRKDPSADGTISVKGESIIDGNPDQILAVLENNKRAHQWMPLVRERKILVQIDKDSRIEYTHISLPWPLKDRYFLDHSRMDRSEGGAINISIKSVDKPQKDWLVPGKVLGFLQFSQIVLTPTPGGQKTHLVIEINSDPRGAIPHWLVNLQQRQWPREFIEGLKDQLLQKGQGR